MLFVKNFLIRWLKFTLDFESVSLWYKQNVKRVSIYEYDLDLCSNKNEANMNYFK